ncbi:MULTISPECIES: secondary thiamine-phosphate synthase enzyme YjbQ [Anaeromyxobacter]|uniref:secondary thiamine-phosphate synthase enzyme YjbQ n=1 Tax=Anaeromyxobacter TaxID=161492 RepID=UPI001F59DB57|nr:MULTISPECIES: secondary thiamine-phosphate synthase enzyme YjbQ [unclassified Anaeromyxobacter]
MLLPPLEIKTRASNELVDVTAEVRAALHRSGVESGVLVAFVPHTTAGITIQENADPDVRTDLLLALANAVPERPPGGAYRHAEGNSDAHVKASLVGSSATIVVERGELVLGTWQGVYLCEFDGPRTRKMLLSVLAG